MPVNTGQRDQIRHALSAGPLPLAQILATLAIEPQDRKQRARINENLLAWRAQGGVIRDEEGRWSLTEAGLERRSSVPTPKGPPSAPAPQMPQMRQRGHRVVLTPEAPAPQALHTVLAVPEAQPERPVCAAPQAAAGPEPLRAELDELVTRAERALWTYVQSLRDPLLDALLASLDSALTATHLCGSSPRREDHAP